MGKEKDEKGEDRGRLHLDKERSGERKHDAFLVGEVLQLIVLEGDRAEDGLEGEVLLGLEVLHQPRRAERVVS